MQQLHTKKNDRGNKMIEIGRVCMKTAGRYAGKKGAVIDVINDNYAILDGQIRRKKCNIKHLEPLDITIKITRNATHEEVSAELKKIGIEVKEKVKMEKAEKKEQKSSEKKKIPAKVSEKA